MAAPTHPAQLPRFEEFRGFVQLMRMLRKLYVRPTRRRSQHAPPIIACVQPLLAEDPGLLESIAVRLRAVDRRRATPYALHRLPFDGGGPADTGPRPFTPDDVVAVSNILHEVAKQLAVEPGDYRFPRFELVRWLMALPVDDGVPPSVRLATLRQKLFHRAIGRDSGRAADAAAGDAAAGDAAAVASALPPWLRASGVVLTPLFFRVRHSGRFLGLGRRYRWFLRQPNMAPALNRSFFGLADRLTGGQWQTEDPEQVLRLVVNAFLEDLREAFRGNGWIRRYRTTYPIVLLDGITRTNGGYALLRTISAVRNYTGRFDPLLLITTGTRVPPLAQEPQIAPATPGQDAVDADLARLEWEARLPRQRRKRAAVAWLVIVRIPEKAGDADLPVLRAKIALCGRSSARTDPGVARGERRSSPARRPCSS